MVRPAKAEFGVLSKGIAVLARATRSLFARLFQGGEREADVKRDLMVGHGLLARHYSGCRADAQSAARGWRERLHEERQRLRNRLSQLETRRERDWRKPATRRRNAVATRKAETRLARVEKELQGRPKHCFGGRDLLRKGHLSAWRRRRDGNALFAGESGKKFGNEVARWDAGRLELKLPAGLGAVVLEDVRFDAKVERELERCIAARRPVSWRVKLLAKGKVQLCVTCEEAEPAIVSEQADGAVGVDVNADHLAVADVSGDGRLAGVGREDARRGSEQRAGCGAVDLRPGCGTGCAGGCGEPRFSHEEGLAAAVRETLWKHPLEFPFAAGDGCAGAAMPPARCRVDRGGSGVDDADPAGMPVSGSVPDRVAPGCCFRDREARSWAMRSA